MPKRVHIVIIEPSAIIRCGLSAVLQRAEGLSIDIAELSTVAELSELDSHHEPDIVIVNPFSLGALSLEELKAELGGNNSKVIALQTSLLDQNILKNFDEVITTTCSVDAIRQKVETVIKLNAELDSKKELSSREKEIIVCVVKGMINKQIAEELCISTHTVITHRKNIAAKLQIHSPAGLTIYAIVNKLVDISEVQSTISST